MSDILRIVLVIISVLSCYYVLRKIRKSQIQIEDSIFWIVFSGIILILSIFPQIAYFCSGMIGIESPVNFVFLVFIFILLFKIFLMSIKISQMEDKMRNLVQNIAIHNEEIKDKEGK